MVEESEEDVVAKLPVEKRRIGELTCVQRRGLRAIAALFVLVYLIILYNARKELNKRATVVFC